MTWSRILHTPRKTIAKKVYWYQQSQSLRDNPTIDRKTKTMVNTEEYVPTSGNYIDVQTIKASPTKMGVVMPGSGTTTFGEGESKVTKPWISIEMDGEEYQWTLSKTANQSLGSELGYETDDWVGAQIKFLVLMAGSTPYVSATVIKKPAGGAVTASEADKLLSE